MKSCKVESQAEKQKLFPKILNVEFSLVCFETYIAQGHIFVFWIKVVIIAISELRPTGLK